MSSNDNKQPATMKKGDSSKENGAKPRKWSGSTGGASRKAADTPAAGKKDGPASKKSNGVNPKHKKHKTHANPTDTLEISNIHELGDEVNLEQFVQHEYMRLHRQYRLMENYRQKIIVQHVGMSKRKEELELFMHEKQNLIVDTVNANSKHWKKMDRHSIAVILEILDDIEKLEIDIHHSIHTIKDMDKNVKHITRKLVDQKLKIMAIFGISMTVAQADKHLKRLENRLYQRTTKFDGMVANNRALREEINTMLKHRGNFYSHMIDMKKQMAVARSRMNDMVFLSTQAYEARDGYASRINLLRDKNDKECRSHVLEMKEFNRILHCDSKRHEFMAIKNQDRQLFESQAQKYERRNLQRYNALGRTLRAYFKTFTQILHKSSFENMAQLVHYYNAHEQENFALFQRLVQTDNEVGHLKLEVRKMQEDIEQLYQLNRTEQKQRQLELENLSDSLSKTNNELDDVLDQWEYSQKQMEIVVGSLDSMFHLLGCSNVAIIRLLGNTHGITPSNATLIVNIIVGRVEDVLRAYKALEIRRQVELEGDSSKTFLKSQGVTILAGPKNKTQGGPFLPKLLVTGRLDGETEEEDDDDRTLAQRPLSYDEMKKRILDRMLMGRKASHRESLALISPTRLNSFAHDGEPGDAESWASVLPQSFT